VVRRQVRSEPGDVNEAGVARTKDDCDVVYFPPENLYPPHTLDAAYTGVAELRRRFHRARRLVRASASRGLARSDLTWSVCLSVCLSSLCVCLYAQDPLPLLYSPDTINVAVHVRRGDVAKDPAKHAGRLTSDAVYVAVVRKILSWYESHPRFGPNLRGRVRVHVFSQGVPVRLPAPCTDPLAWHILTRP
jgi:hypothetical protein